jgi:protein-tyrosine phosphatase
MPSDLVPAGDDEALLMRRVLHLEGGTNFSDLGGHQTQDGRRLRWGMLYCAGNLGGLTQADHDYLAGLNIRSVCDLRTQEEREVAPNRWAATAGIDDWSPDYKSSFGVLRELLAADLRDPEATRAAMQAEYRYLPFEHLPAYRTLFDRLIAGQVPLVFNCTAGKDRASGAAALISSLLGVPRETILHDYMRTDRVREAEWQKVGDAKQAMPTRLSPEIRAIVMTTHPIHLEFAFVVVGERRGIDRRLFSRCPGD